MHVQADLLNGIGNVRAGERQILESTSNAAVGRRVNDMGTSSSKLGRSVHGHQGRVARAHASTLENLESVPSLGKEHPMGITSNGKAEEVMKLSQVGHGKLDRESGDDAL